MRLVLTAVLATLPLQAEAAAPPAAPFALCRAAIAAAERASGVPDRLMQAIGVVESGRADERGIVAAWPWTINVEGVGQVFDTKAEAIAAVQAHRARGARSIDVGCMQVNLLHHADAFASLDQAFDPAANARYAANFLVRLLAQTGSWPRAAAGYHSLTPDIGAEYARKVLAVWARPAPSPASASPSPFAMAGAALPPALPPPGAARILPLPAGAAPTGRGLDAYRAAPTRLATNLLLRPG